MRKILAIDDSKTIRLAIKITFAAEDAEVVAVSKGSEAVARAKHMGAQVVLVDHSLAASEPSGFDVVRALKSDAGTASTPVLLMVPEKAAYDENEASACGADDIITKPFDSQMLLDKVAALIGSGASAKPAAAASAPQPAAQPAAKPAAVPTPRAAPAPKPVPTPRAAPTPRPAPAPRATPASAPAAAAAAPAAPASSGNIPIAVPIPFAASDAPTGSMLARLKGEGSAATGLDPAAVSALLALTHEVVEQVVWEVVPELAEQLIRDRSNNA